MPGFRQGAPGAHLRTFIRSAPAELSRETCPPCDGEPAVERRNENPPRDRHGGLLNQQKGRCWGHRIMCPKGLKNRLQTWFQRGPRLTGPFGIGAEAHLLGWRNRHPELWSMYHRTLAFVVTDQPFSLVPNNEAWKGLRNALLVSAYPCPPDDQLSIIVPRGSIDRLPLAHSVVPLSSARARPGDGSSSASSPCPARRSAGHLRTMMDST